MDNLILSITTIGDLLLHNKITRNGDSKAIENVKLNIPEYQRPYKWTARNAIQLLDDIIEAKNENKEVYRVGTLILHKDKDEKGNVRYNIVDGQQRTITFSLLLYALYEATGETVIVDFLGQQVSIMNIAVVIFPIIIMPSNVESVRKKRGMKSLTMRETSGNCVSLSKNDVN